MAPTPTVAVFISFALAAPALAQVGAPFTQLIDDFSQGAFSRASSWTSPGAQVDQPGLNVLGGRRLSNLVILPPNSSFGSQIAGIMSVDTSNTGTFSFSEASFALPTSVVVVGYRAAALGTISNMMANLNFPGTHGVAVDFLSLSAPIFVQIELATIAPGQSGRAVWQGTINPAAGNEPFRFRTTWSQYTFDAGFTLSQVDQIFVMFRPAPGSSATLGAVGISPSPSAAALLGLAACTAMRRRRN
ncbi:MAG: hypothetical protein ACREJO_14945 [Phycisphaerales bacterium]